VAWRVCCSGAALGRYADQPEPSPPAVTSSNILQLEIGCGDPYHIAVFAEHGPVLTKDGRGEPDYFYERGRILAVIDGSEFPLVAAGSGDAVILLSEGPAEDNYLADIDEEFIEALLNGSSFCCASISCRKTLPMTRPTRPTRCSPWLAAGN